jgi:hypothetical protein
MKIFRNSLFLVLLLPLFSRAQSYQPGFVVNMKGDTLRGSIDYAEWDNNPGTISFKDNVSATPQKLGARDIRFFSVAVGHFAAYESYSGPISTDHVDINHLSVGRDTALRYDTVFLNILQDGKNLRLYRYSDNQKVRFFIAAGNEAQPKELTYRIYLKDEETNGVDRTTYETAFKGQLYDAAVKAGMATPALKEMIAKADYKEADLLQVTNVINGISAGDTIKTYATKTKPSHLGLAIVAAAVVVVVLISEFSSVGHPSH